MRLILDGMVCRQKYFNVEIFPIYGITRLVEHRAFCIYACIHGYLVFFLNKWSAILRELHNIKHLLKFTFKLCCCCHVEVVLMSLLISCYVVFFILSVSTSWVGRGEMVHKSVGRGEVEGGTEIYIIPRCDYNYTFYKNRIPTFWGVQNN